MRDVNRVTRIASQGTGRQQASAPLLGASAQVLNVVACMLASGGPDAVNPARIWPLHAALLRLRADALAARLPDPLHGAPTRPHPHIGTAVEGAADAVWSLRLSRDLVPCPAGRALLVVPADRMPGLRRRLLSLPPGLAAPLGQAGQLWNAWESANEKPSRSPAESPAATTTSGRTRRHASAPAAR